MRPEDLTDPRTSALHDASLAVEFLLAGMDGGDPIGLLDAAAASLQEARALFEAAPTA